MEGMGMAQQSQCSVVNAFTAMSLLPLQLALHTVARNNSVIKTICTGAMIVMMVYYTFISGVEKIVVMHQIMGMMALEAGTRSIDGVLVTITTRAELVIMFCLFIPNLFVVLGETSFGFGEYGSFHFHSLNHFAHTEFFRKQHAFLHGALCIYVLGICSSFRPCWRHCPRVQRARILLEPMCLVSLGMILITHTHGSDDPEHLPSHPIIGCGACLAGLSQMCKDILHLSYPPEGKDRLHVDLAVKGADTPVLKMVRLLSAFIWMVVANFLFVDTFMEYMGCRYDLLMFGPPGVGPRQGLTPKSEATTYLAQAIMLATLSIVAIILLEGPISINSSKAKMLPEMEFAETEPVLGEKA